MASHAEVTGTKPGGPPPGSTTTTLTDLCVQYVQRVDRELLDAQALVGHLVSAGSIFAFLAEHRLELFADEEFEDLFPSGRGRPSIRRR